MHNCRSTGPRNSVACNLKRNLLRRFLSVLLFPTGSNVSMSWGYQLSVLCFSPSSPHLENNLAVNAIPTACIKQALNALGHLPNLKRFSVFAVFRLLHLGPAWSAVKGEEFDFC